jgi:hypothetical protein
VKEPREEEKDERERREQAARHLRSMAARERDPAERDRLRNAAAEHDGLSLTGDASHRAKP